MSCWCDDFYTLALVGSILPAGKGTTWVVKFLLQPQFNWLAHASIFYALAFVAACTAWANAQRGRFPLLLLHQLQWFLWGLIAVVFGFILHAGTSTASTAALSHQAHCLVRRFF